MADKILQTNPPSKGIIIRLRYDTYQNWMNSELILQQGEAAIAVFPRSRNIEDLSNSQPENTPPAIGIKIGDGESYFYELPWVQAIAADVYEWAKTPSKPSYSASEITNLANYIATHAPAMPGDGTVAPRIYQIVKGTGDDRNKYFLQYRESTDVNNWIVDTEHYIDLEKLQKILDWIIESNMEEDDLFTKTGQQTLGFIRQLAYTDTPVENQYVTGVSETNGKITVTRKRPTFSEIAGIVSVGSGGTGRSILPRGEVLIGNDDGNVTTRAIAEEIAANNQLVPNYLIKAYVDNAVAGLEGAMHFVGDATVEPIGATNPQINDYNFAHAQPGDVVLYEAKEYVWTGSNWRLLGDEGSYAVKGSIKNADIDEDAAIDQSKIAGLDTSFDGKVDKVAGKGLSTRDYTDEDWNKLRGIQDNAQQNVIEHILLNDVEQSPHIVNGVDKTVELNIKEFDDESRRKLGTIEENAQENTIESISVNGTAQSISLLKNVDLTINEFTTEYENKLEAIEDEAQVNVIERIILNGAEVFPDQSKIVYLDITGTLSQQQIDKLESIEEGAQVNLIEHIVYDGDEIYPDNNKTITITSDPHTEHENVIEGIQVNGTTQTPNDNKIVNLILNAQTLGIATITGAEVPNNFGGTEDVNVVNSKLQLAQIAMTGNVASLIQTTDTYMILDCGSSTDVI